MERAMWVTPGHSKSIFCFEQGLIPLCFPQKFLAFRSRLIFFCRLNFSGDRLIQFIDGPLRTGFLLMRPFLAVADQNSSFTGCFTARTASDLFF
jgi:hypothetical protein